MSKPEILVPEYTFDDWKLLPNDPIQGNQPYQAQDRSTFSPLPSNPFSIEGGFILLLILKLAKEQPQTFERLATKYLDSCARIVESVEESCHSNWLTALNNQHIAAGIAHRIGLIDNGAFVKIMNHYQSVFDKMWQAQMAGHVLEGITTFVGQTKTGIGEKGTGSAGLAALANIFGAKV